MVQSNPSHKIKVEIDTQGNIHAEVQGVEGNLCELLSAFLREMGDVIEDRKTSDYYKIPKQTIKTEH